MFQTITVEGSSLKTGLARPGPAGALKTALVVTAVNFDQFSLYSTGTSALSNDRLSLLALYLVLVF